MKRFLVQYLPSAATVAVVAMTVVVVLAASGGVVSAAPNLADKINEAANKVEKVAENMCIINDNCNSFWTLKNYCCLPQCCDVISYVTRNDNYWENFTKTFEQPRALNIILGVLFVLLAVLLIGIVVKLICCLFCGCCGTKKYVIVGRGD